MSYSSEPSVLILMGTFNGEKYIREQLDSIAAQSHKNWRLVISDDGSTDKTLEIARQWAKEVGELRVDFVDGPRQGFARNFLSMVANPELVADIYALCDQDDVWMSNKLEVALSHLNSVELASKPALYCGRTQYVDDELKHLGYSLLFVKPPGFKNALVQCLAGGNTMVFNKPLKSALTRVGIVPAVSHDWWLYQLTTGMDGCVFYDQQPLVRYRQHLNGLVGKNTGLRSIIIRLRMALAGDFHRLISQNISCLEMALYQLSEDNKHLLIAFKNCRGGTYYHQTVGLISLGLYRQTIIGNIGLIVLAILRKI